MEPSANQVLPQAVQDLLTTLSVELSSSNISTLRLVDDALSNLLRTTVRTPLNKCAAVNRLPPEVLSAIFKLLRSGSLDCDDIYEHHPPMLRPDNRSLIVVTHVCRLWRNVSLGCAQLWTNISTICPLAPKFFERSQEMPLAVSVSLVRGRMPPRVPKRVFLDQLPRIKVLHIDLECSAQIRHWIKHLQGLAKSLESLTIAMHGREAHHRANPPLVVPFFGKECPISLRFLSISSTTVLFPNDHFPALEHAHLSMFSFEKALPRTLLTNAPRLQTFHLHLQPTALGSLFKNSPTIDRIRLPVMRHLCIALPRIPTMYRAQDGHYGAVRTMLANLDLPGTAVISIQETCMSGSWPNLYILPAADSAVESVLTTDSRGMTFVIVSPPTPTTYFRYASRFTPMNIRFLDSMFMAHHQGTKNALATVRALRIHSCPRWLRASPRTFYLHSLATFVPHLTTLVLRDYTGEMAAHLAFMLNRRGAGSVPCPALTAVTYITLGRVFVVHAGRFVPSPPLHPTANPTQAPGAASLLPVTPGLDTILAATANRARALGRRLPRLVFCCPSIAHASEYVLENAHGVERVEVRGTDAWAAPDSDSKSDGVFARGGEARGHDACHGSARGPDCGLTRNADKLARKAGRGAARTLEEEYGALWAQAERVRVALEEAQTQTQSRAGTAGTASGSGCSPLSLAVETSCVRGAVGESSSSSAPAPESESSSSEGPGVRMAGGGLEIGHLGSCNVASPEVAAAPEQGAAYADLQWWDEKEGSDILNVGSYHLHECN